MRRPKARHTTPAREPQRKVWLFKLISFLVPLFVIFLIEISLRFFHYGYDPDLFITYAADRDFMVLNPEASKKYFSNQRNATTGNVEPFRKKKADNTLRIFVLGESTTIGYPYFHNGSFHRWLQYRLSHTFPDRAFEIVNVALTAVNSYTVAGFAKEIIHYQPDAVLIYTGHNEYYGALGVGSTEKTGSNPTIVRLVILLREFRFVQLLTNVFDSLTGSGTPTEEGTRMQRMVSDQQIAYQSTLYHSGAAQFRSNMDQTLALFYENHIPVFVSNLVSNEKDLKPFFSFSVDNKRFPGFAQHYNTGVKALKDKRYAQAKEFLKAAEQVYDLHAACNFYLGEAEYGLGNFKSAKAYYTKAKDLDGLRFRAPEEFNRILFQLAKKYSNTFLVNTKGLFEARSANGIIGDSLILEHVHPNLKGYALLSDAFYEALKTKKIISPVPRQELSFGQLLNKMPITKVDSLAGMYKIANLKASWPFSQSMRSENFKVTSFEEKLAYDLANRKTVWLDVMDKLYSHYINGQDLSQALTTVETLILEYPTDAQYYLKAAMLCGELKDEPGALFHFKKAFQLSPTFDVARYLFVLHLKADQPEEAIPYLNYAIENNTSRFDVSAVRENAQQIIHLKKDSGNSAAMEAIVGIYLKMDNREGALNYIKKVLISNPQNREAIRLRSALVN